MIEAIDPPPAVRTAAEYEAELDQLRHLLAESVREMAELRRRATFPEQNPNLVIELDRQGRISYQNPEAAVQVPDLAALGAQHPLLREYQMVLRRFVAGEVEPIVCEVNAGERVFEQKWCPTYSDDQLVVRVFAHDVTDRTRAEQAIQRLARKVVTAQEEERHRVSRELHDEAGQALTALKISLQLILAELPPDSGPALDLARAVGLVDSTREGIRALARGLRPPALDAVGLNLSLEDTCRTLAELTGLAIDYHGDAGADGLPDAVSVCLYRLLQEALTNAARHAAAEHVTVRLTRAADGVRLTVQDDGSGFALSGPGRRGLGLRGMTERLDLLGGSLQVKSEPAVGTTVEAWVPLGELP